MRRIGTNKYSQGATTIQPEQSSHLYTEASLAEWALNQAQRALLASDARFGFYVGGDAGRVASTQPEVCSVGEWFPLPF